MSKQTTQHCSNDLSESSYHPCGEKSPASIPLQRNNYFKGKFMTARDFQTDTDYVLGRIRLANRLQLGWGIACGLEVRLEKGSPDCSQTDTIRVTAGIAIDSYGREIVLSTDHCGKIETLTDGKNPNETTDFLVAICYCEQETEVTALMFPDAGDSSCGSSTEFNRIADSPRIKLFPKTDPLFKKCWAGCEEELDTNFQASSDTPGAKDPCCPKCDCKSWVPLGVLSYSADRGWKLGFDHLRRIETKSCDLLTRIENIEGWKHGKLSHDVGKIDICFTRPLDKEHHGINEHSLRVFFIEKKETTSGPQTQREVVEPDAPPCYDHTNRKVIINLENWLKWQKEYHGKDGELELELKCDFIIDENGSPVDGNFLKGEFPTGNGTPGGIFRSWMHFEVKKESKDKA